VDKVGFIGLGNMGEPMAGHLLDAGFELWVTAHRQRGPIERLVARGAHEEASAASLASKVDAIVTCVPDDEAVREVLFGEQGVSSGGQEGLYVVDASTVSPETSKACASQLAHRGITMLDAPISGGQVGAIAGTLAIMVGGPEDAFHAVEPLLEAMGEKITYVGDNGSALVVKLCNNLIVGAIMLASSEALTMATKAGVDPGLVHSVLSSATCRGWIIQEKLAATLLEGNLEPGFKLKLMRKDMGIVQEYGRVLGVPMFVSGLVHQLYTHAQAAGKGDKDSYAVSEVYTDAVGVSLKRRE